jgi:hypothetical protein
MIKIFKAFRANRAVNSAKPARFSILSPRQAAFAPATQQASVGVSIWIALKTF